VPMNAVFTADEWRRYLGDFKITALLTRAGSNAACRAVAHDLAIPVIDLFSGAADSPCAFRLVGPSAGRAAWRHPRRP